MSFERIVVPTDLSNASKAAFLVAAKEADPAKTKIKLVYIIPTELLPEADNWAPKFPETSKYTEAEIKYAQKSLEEISAEYFSGLNVEQLIISPPCKIPAQEIAKVADEFQSDAIFISSAGKGFLKRVVVGSTVQKLLQIANCPVIVVPFEK